MWCAVCDPSPEARAQRVAVGGRRHPPGSAEAKKRHELRDEATIDEIVRRALHFAAKLEKMKTDDHGAAARIAFAASRLYAQAIAGLKARGSVGDLTPKPKMAPAGSQAPLVGSPSLEGLDEGLDS